MPTVDMEDPPSIQHCVLFFDEIAEGEHGGGGGDGHDSLVYPDFRPSSLPTRRDSFSSLPPRRDSNTFLPLEHDFPGFLPPGPGSMGFLPPGSTGFLRSRRDSNASLHSFPHQLGTMGGTRDIVVPKLIFFIQFICALS
jgi:hypothetical protein